MTNYFSSDFTLGILGGGQLGKMLLTETRKFDIATKVLDPSAEAPCRIGSNTFVQGSLTDFDTVYQFGKDVQVLTIEIENVNVDALEKLQAEGVQVYPTPQTIRQIQNKAVQKQFYAANEPSKSVWLKSVSKEANSLLYFLRVSLSVVDRLAPATTKSS